MLEKKDLQTLAKLLQHSFKKHIDKVAIVDDGISYTYKELSNISHRISRHLSIKKLNFLEPRVAVIIPRSADYVFSISGCILTGLTYVPLNLDSPLQRIKFMLEKSNLSIILTNNTYHAQVLSLLGTENKYEIININLIQEDLISYNDESIIKNNCACILFTSGSTGQPKGVKITSKSIINLVTRSNYLSISSDDKMLNLTHVSFDLSLFNVWGALLNGACNIIVKENGLFNADYLNNLINSYKISMALFPTAAFNQLSDVCRKAFLTIKTIIIAGEKANSQIIRNYIKEISSTNKLINAYGPTENATFSTFYTIKKKSTIPENIPIGKPISGTKAFLLDANMKLVKPGLEGQIYVGGNNLSDGYIDNIIENSKKFIQLRLNDKLERLYKTGDLAYLNSKDDLVYTGREDYEFKCNGMRINPSEIEECLESNTAVKTATIVFYENSIHVYIVFNNLSISEDELKRFLKRKLPQYMIPSVYHYLDNLPLTERGKIDKSLLIDQLKAENDVGCNFSNIKETLLKIWENILQIPTINENENFFELGGDSIHALQIASQARSAGIKFNPADIYKYPTILQIAQVCESLTVSDNKLKIKFDVPNKVSPTPIQQWFFSLPLSNRLYFSQSFIFDVDPQTNIERLKNAIDKTIQSQAIFDGFWKYDNNMWFFIPLQRRTSLLFDVIYADSNDLQSQIISQTESTLNIETGRFVAFNLFIDAHENPYKLHFAAHHIAMDGVSWRILVKNIHFHYHNLSRTENKNYDYIKWASRVNQRTNLISDNIKKYWFESPWIEKYHLPSNMINNKGSELWKDHHEYSFSLGSSDTEKLRQQVLKNCGVKINAVLLAALYKAWFRVTSKKDLVLILEGHGREQSVLFEDDIKFTETIGWFTALFPVILNSENIDDIQDMLDYIPNRGVEFLPILYNLMDQTARKAFGCIPIKFNYLSEFSSIDSNKILSFSQKVDHIMDDLSNMSCDIDIEGMIINKQLKFTALVSDKVNQENAELFFSFYKEELLNIIRKFSSITHEVFCLLPLQKNIYYQCKRIKDFELYLINAKILFEGDFQTNDIVLAWKKIILSYDFFRLKLSDFFSNEQLYQYTEILSEKSEYPIKVIDLTSGTPPDFNLKEIITKKQMEFSLKSNTFLFYIFIIKHSKNKFEILWMHHHIFIDGWTINFIVNQFIENHLQCNFKKTKSFLDSSKDLFSPGLVSDNFWNNYFDGKIKKMKNLCLNKQIKGKHCLNIYSLNEKLKNNICSLTKKLKISKNTLFQAVWGMALCCYFKTLSILYCSVFSLRDSEEPAGFYVNTLPIFFDCPDEGQNFDSWILTFQNDLGEIAKHKYPSLFDIFGENYELIDKGLLNTLFVYEDYSNLSLKNDSFKLKSIQIFEKTHFPITFLLREYTEIDIVMSFYDDFVDKKNAKNIMYLYISILQNICSEDFTISSYTDYYSLMMSEKLHIDACVD